MYLLQEKLYKIVLALDIDQKFIYHLQNSKRIVETPHPLCIASACGRTLSNCLSHLLHEIHELSAAERC